MKLSRSLIAVGAITALSVGALAGCSSSGSADDGDSGGTGAALTIAKPDGAITTESHNPYLGDSSASKYGYAKVIFEPLALVNPTGDLGTTPWLAESVEWNDAYTELTVVPRSGVTWSDGEDFTADDIVFTFDQYLSGKLADSQGLNYEGATVDGDAVTLKFADSKFTAQSRVLHTPIVPQHVWENIDDPNTDPLTGEGLAVGTGPYVLGSWTTESVTLTANEDYWGGDLAVPELNYVSYGDNAALTTALASGEADWAQAFLPQIEESYLSVDPDNQFLVSPTAGAGTLFMNLQTKPFNDPALREALAWTIDRQAYVDIAREGASDPVWNVTGLGTLLEDEITPEYKGDELLRSTSSTPRRSSRTPDTPGRATSSSTPMAKPCRSRSRCPQVGATGIPSRRSSPKSSTRPSASRSRSTSPTGAAGMPHARRAPSRRSSTGSRTPATCTACTPRPWTRSGSSTTRRSTTSAASTTPLSPRR